MSKAGGLVCLLCNVGRRASLERLSFSFFSFFFTAWDEVCGRRDVQQKRLIDSFIHVKHCRCTSNVFVNINCSLWTFHDGRFVPGARSFVPSLLFSFFSLSNTNGFLLFLFCSCRGGGYGMSSVFGSSYSSAQLSHDHSTQYTFVWQSLLLWSEAMRSMYR